MKRLPLLALIGVLAAFFGGCTTVPETGRRQIIITSPAEEAQMGLSAFAQIKESEPISTNVMANDRITRIGRRIARSVGRDLPNANWEFVVFESNELNAFALPGGKVGVYTGLINLAESDDELAAVMGHEIAHVSSRHSGERYSQQILAAGLTVVADEGMKMAEMDPQKRQIAMATIGGGAQVGLLKYSRVHESEADTIGVRFAAGAGYDPRAAITFWQRMQKANEGRAEPWELLSTHPSNATRIRNLQQIAPKYVPLYLETKAKIENGTFYDEPASVTDTEIGAP
ncbi:M48 family metallopeptidase [Synoicihabitans lomoniglobus]|uniref:M48 family metallopeptidase n=1 Tax=Synoicihabitans lomoniglobus TaxID=2909285 RepID=A0AAF0CRY2_9BACT|nr:M48 family metallopeptidase [Opitutaceae bacterium LMO-M01]WED66876.1 M48 family metallopeptidase [Opitutaceae bacterium LMO-M01]